MSTLDKNSVSLAGEFAVLSQLSLRGYDANMTLGRTKGVDILISDPNNSRMLKLEVKTNYRSARSTGGNSRIFGRFVSAWLMGEKHETMTDPNLFYCFVNISEDTKLFRFFIVPSKVVAEYLKTEHKLWISDTLTEKNDGKMRTFRLGTKADTYSIPTPTVEKYEDNWAFEDK